MNVKNLICHRMPERSFFYKGHQFPVCARCTGVYLSLATIPILKYLNLSLFSLIVAAIVLIAPMAIDGTTQLLGFRESNNYLRLFTGFIGGMGTLCFAFASKMFIMEVI